MKRINQIIGHETYKEYLKRNELAEGERRFCRHNMAHFLDVARIAMILNLQEGYGVSGELLYGAALLHDIGRWRQYLEGVPHEKASADLADPILEDCGYTETEKEEILEAVLSHRDAAVRQEKNLKGLLYRADKLSRSCFCCQAEAECDWENRKKNLELLL